MTSFSPSAQAGRNSPTGIEANAAVSDCRKAQVTAVGAVLQAESELDAVIRELGQKGVQAMDDGDPDGARIYADRMYAAIRSRTPEHQARLTSEVWRRLDESTFSGNWALELAGKYDVPAHGMRRVRYVMSLIYWTLRHRSLSRGRWVADYSCTKGLYERA